MSTPKLFHPAMKSVIHVNQSKPVLCEKTTPSKPNMKKLGSGHDDDPSWRYERETVQVVYSNTNGQTTQCTNLQQICADLKCPITALCEHLQKRLGVPKIGKDGKLPGRWTPIKLDGMIDDFIEKYILCPKCFNPN